MWTALITAVVTLLQIHKISAASATNTTEGNEWIPFLNTGSYEYFLAVTAEDTKKATEICRENKINFTDFFYFNDGIAAARNGKGTLTVENEVVKETGCLCDCPATPAPFTRAPCRKPLCHISTPNPLCTQTEPRQCTITQPPNCKVTQANCSVDCREECIITKQPTCMIVASGKPRCQLKPVGPCELSKPNCTIVDVGKCTAVQDKCEHDDSACKPVIRPCKNPCSERECTTVEVPCVTTQKPCITVTPSCGTPPPTNSTCTMEKKCRKSRETDGKLSCEVVPVCPNATLTTPAECRPVTTCPPAETTCFPPVSACTTPFLDCSPEVCQSSVQICLPGTIRCPPARIVCEDPKIECSDAVSRCPEPEVVCDQQPEIKCTKAIVDCPNAVVHCDPIITTCDAAPTQCTTPNMDCKSPEITCQEPVTCAPDPTPYFPCRCDNKKCQEDQSDKRRSGKGRTKNRRRDPLMLPADAEYVDRTMCIAMRRDLDFKWVTQSCNLKYNFICQRKVRN